MLEFRRSVMNRDDAEQYLSCAMSIGEQLLINGAEVSRVEDTIRRICMAYGALRVDVFSITSSIVTTMYGEGFGTCTQTRRVSGMSNDLNKLDELNELSRNICETRPEPERIAEALEKIQNGPRYSLGVQILIYALISGSFSLFFGGNLKDMGASAIIGVLLKFLETVLGRTPVNTLITALLCSVAGGFCANLLVLTGIGAHTDLISIGNIMLLIPGIAFTNALRDMFSGDTITGAIRFVESVLRSVIIALGFTFAGFLF